MKVRLGHVSNSSSASFILDTSTFSAKVLRQLKNKIAEGKTGWVLGEAHLPPNEKIVVSTWMDNFDMHYYLTVELGLVEGEHFEGGRDY